MCYSSEMLEMMKKKVYLKSTDGERMEAEESLMAESGLIRSLLTNTTNSHADILIELDNVDSATLSLLIEYCRIPDHSTLDHQFIEFIVTRFHTPQILHDLMLAAETLEIDGLLNLTRNRIEEYDAELQIERNLESREQNQTLALRVVSISVILITMIYCGVYVFHKHIKKN